MLQALPVDAAILLAFFINSKVELSEAKTNFNEVKETIEKL